MHSTDSFESGQAQAERRSAVNQDWILTDENVIHTKRRDR